MVNGFRVASRPRRAAFERLLATGAHRNRPAPSRRHPSDRRQVRWIVEVLGLDEVTQFLGGFQRTAARDTSGMLHEQLNVTEPETLALDDEEVGDSVSISL